MQTIRHFVSPMIVLLLAGCASPPPAVSEETAPASPSNEPHAVTDEPITLETVWDKVGCKEDDFTGSFGTISEADPPVTRTGSCYAFGVEETSFFYELENETSARDWYRSGALEVGANDTLFIEGGVIMLATAPRAADEFADMFDFLD